jgi:hypothetical protein
MGVDGRFFFDDLSVDLCFPALGEFGRCTLFSVKFVSVRGVDIFFAFGPGDCVVSEFARCLVGVLVWAVRLPRISASDCASEAMLGPRLLSVVLVLPPWILLFGLLRAFVALWRLCLFSFLLGLNGGGSTLLIDETSLDMVPLRDLAGVWDRRLLSFFVGDGL